MIFNRMFKFPKQILVLVMMALVMLSCDTKFDSAESDKKKREPEVPITADSGFMKANKNIPKFQGRSVSISICGLDTRVGENIHHADANHVVRLWLDEGAVEIIDIPRDTYAPAGLGGDLNTLANLRANKGRTAYLNKVKEIAGVQQIDYYCELGFSQAYGLLELLGYSRKAETLQALRSRQAFAAGDYQRTYNQGVFMKNILLKHFDKATGWFSSSLLNAALLLVETNLSADSLSAFADILSDKGFPDKQLCFVRVAPKFSTTLAAYNIDDRSVLNSVHERIEQHNRWSKNEPSKVEDVSARIQSLITKAVADSAKYPKNVIISLEPLLEQRAWLQVSSASEQKRFAREICLLLITAYNKTGKKDKALNTLGFYERYKEYVGDL
jgi:anionic cell wall polymer biosynthesis LytR-Cps2A-Psr (LCP) family protein